MQRQFVCTNILGSGLLHQKRVRSQSQNIAHH